MNTNHLLRARPVVFGNADDAYLLIGHPQDLDDFVAELPHEIAVWKNRHDGETISVVVHPAEGYWDGPDTLGMFARRSGVDIVIRPHGAVAQHISVSTHQPIQRGGSR